MKTKTIDYSLFFVVFALMVFGMIMISSVSVYPSYKVTNAMVALGKLKEPNNYFYLIRNISHVIISIVALAFFAKNSYKNLEKYAKQIFGSTIIFLFIVLIVGVKYNGARGWINIPFIPFSLQPAEFLKLGLIIYLAYFLKRRRLEISNFKDGLMPFMLTVMVIVLLLALQPDFGTILIIVPISLIMLFAAGGNVKHILLLIIGSFLFGSIIYFIGKYSGGHNSLSYISQRIDNFISDNKTSIQNNSINFQTLQGLIAIGSGGFFGLGFGKSIQKFGYLPEVQGDFIFSVIGEELGFFGILILVSLFLFIAYRGFSIAQRVSDGFAKYTAVGITSWIMLQAFINIGVNLNIVPLTGITLPFVSYGGSSLLSLMIGIGILLNISRDCEFGKAKASSGGFFKKHRVKL